MFFVAHTLTLVRYAIAARQKFGGVGMGAGFKISRDLDSETEWPRCPECGREAERFFKQNGVVIGCWYCIREVDAIDI